MTTKLPQLTGLIPLDFFHCVQQLVLSTRSKCRNSGFADDRSWSAITIGDKVQAWHQITNTQIFNSRTCMLRLHMGGWSQQKMLADVASQLVLCKR